MDNVRHFFDAYAEGFEKSLVERLGYDNPRQLRECLMRYNAQKGQKNNYGQGLDQKYILFCAIGITTVDHSLPFIFISYGRSDHE